MTQTAYASAILCRHCGDTCRDRTITFGDHTFCCDGCRAVFDLLHQAHLAAYYDQDVPPGVRPADVGHSSKFAYLDDASARDNLLDFAGATMSRVTLSVPQVHCSSCVWLLENLFRLHAGIDRSHVNFLDRTVEITFNPQTVSLREVVELLARLGYEPDISLERLHKRAAPPPVGRSLALKVGIAGFCFANIMLMSLPSYLSDADHRDLLLSTLFGYISLALSLPVLGYSARDYFSSAVRGLRSKTVTIEFPIALGLLVLFGRSLYDIIAGASPGFLDSMSGLVFFLLLGRVFQRKTYDRLSFERDYRAYFPAYVTKKLKDTEQTVPITSVNPGDRILVRNQEIIPADAIVMRGEGHIDYSFVTGESDPQTVSSGQRVFAGGRQVGAAIELEVIKEVSQSYLTRLWNDNVLGDAHPARSVATLANMAGKYFTVAILIIASATALYWFPKDHTVAWQAVTSVLIVACPCALALSSPFVLGTAMRILGRHRLYLRSSEVVEALASIDTIVFDKTGTLTTTVDAIITFDGKPLDPFEQTLIKSLVRHSTHPLSRSLAHSLASERDRDVADFEEHAGQGISGTISGHVVRLGRKDWILQSNPARSEFAIPTTPGGAESTIFVSFDNVPRGSFRTAGRYRDGLEDAVAALGNTYQLGVLSGDNDRDRGRLSSLFGATTSMLFDQSPYDKLAHIQTLQKANRKVLMVGDGLNDAGALRAASAGLTVSEDMVGFSPACDGILDATALQRLHQFLQLARLSVTVVLMSFALSILYNFIGVGFAVRGELSPLLSAILMPTSSITVVLFAVTLTRLQARRVGL